MQRPLSVARPDPRRASDDTFDLTITGDDNVGCTVQPGTEWTMARVSPDPAVDLSDRVAIEQEGRPATFADLAGIWLQVGDARWLGLLLALQLDGTFVIDGDGLLTEAPMLRGNWIAGPGGVISLAGDRTSRCRLGDAWTLHADVLERGLLEVRIAEPTEATCLGASGTHWTLVRLSPYSAPSRHLAPPAMDLGSGVPVRR